MTNAGSRQSHSVGNVGLFVGGKCCFFPTAVFPWDRVFESCLLLAATTTTVCYNCRHLILFQPIYFDRVWRGNYQAAIPFQHTKIEHTMPSLESSGQNQPVSIWSNY